jgi:P-type Cu+ transporter
MTEQRTIQPYEDPVCGMEVDRNKARADGMTFTYEGREYVFCSKACLLEFQENPGTYLDPNYKPSM